MAVAAQLPTSARSRHVELSDPIYPGVTPESREVCRLLLPVACAVRGGTFFSAWLYAFCTAEPADGGLRGDQYRAGHRWGSFSGLTGTIALLLTSFFM